jgi:hypothetical protein
MNIFFITRCSEARQTWRSQSCVSSYTAIWVYFAPAVRDSGQAEPKPETTQYYDQRIATSNEKPAQATRRMPRSVKQTAGTPRHSLRQISSAGIELAPIRSVGSGRESPASLPIYKGNSG